MEVLGIKLPLREVTEAKRRYILHYAPFYKSVQELAKALGFSRTLIYRHIKSQHDVLLLEDLIGTRTKETPLPEVEPLAQFAETLLHDGRIEIKAEEVSKIRKRYKNKEVDLEEKPVKKGVTVGTKSVTIKKRNIKSKVLQDERVDIALHIMELYEQGSSIRQACLGSGVTPKTFYSWLDENHREYSAVITKIYIEAKKKVRRMLQDELLSHAQTSLLTMIQDRELTRTTKYGSIDSTGKVVAKSVIQTSYVREASYSAVLQVLQGLGKAIGQTYDDVEKGTGEYAFMTEEQLDEFIREEQQRLQELMQEQEKLGNNEHKTSQDREIGQAKSPQ